MTEYSVRIVNPWLSNAMNTTFIVVNNGPHFVPLLITPAITDVNLYNHIIGYTQRMNLVQDIEGVVQRELSNYYGYPSVVQSHQDYKIFLINDNYYEEYTEDEKRLIDDESSDSLPRSEDIDYLDLIVYPRIEDNGLESYIIGVLHSNEFINFAHNYRHNTREVNRWVENRIREYQASH